MLLENSFEVPAKLDHVWGYLTDVEKVVPCMPGASLTETVDEENFKGKVTIKLGPVSMALAGKIKIAERNDQEHRIVLDGSGMEQRGKGRVAAKITTTAEEAAGGTRVNVMQDLKVQGQMASMSRGMMQDVSAKLTKQFADCLQRNLETGEPAAAAAPAGAKAGAAAGGGEGAGPATGERAAPTRPAATGGEVKGIGLALSALGAAVKRFLARLSKKKRSGDRA
ncbi:MAG: SRPBCC family protein [Actinomycetota bacterium]